ncbi:MAG: hypothetical protein EOP49_01755 [Sphingobacteriales bacterium]|nr:MAG: hypothetical protein EOP49_01755 [Sphingobacteriales bacterium]
MLKLIKSNLLVMAMIIALGGAVSANVVNKSKATKMWGNNSGTWVDLTGKIQQPNPGDPGDYRCDLDETVCRAEFPDNIDPNVGSHVPLAEYPGEYIPLL